MSSFKKKWIWAAAVGAITTVLIGYSGTAFGYVARTDAPSGSAGTYGYNAQGQSEITGGDTFYVSSASGNGNPLSTYSGVKIDYFEYATDGITIDNGNDTSGGIYHFDLVSAQGVVQDSNNGYLEVGQSSVSQWITALKGESTYVSARLWNTTFTDETTGYTQTFPVSDISEIVNMSGASFAPNDPAYNHTVYATNPPSSVSVDFPSGSTVTQGQSLALNLQEGIEAYHSNYHYEYLQVVGADGEDYTSQAGFSYEGAATGTQTLSTTLTHGTDAGQTVQMQEVKGGGTTSYPPAPVTTINGGGGYSSPEYLNTGSLPAQTYTVYYQVKDYYNRAGTTASASFTVNPAVGPTVSITGNPTSLAPGQSSTLTATVTNVPINDYIRIQDLTAASLGGSSTYSDRVTGETSLSTQATYYASGTNNYVAQLINKSTGAVDATSSQVSVTWQQSQQATITLTATPNPAQSGQAVALTYNTSGWSFGDYVNVFANATAAFPTDYGAFDTYYHTEYPTNGAQTTIAYQAYLYNGLDQVIATSSPLSVTWTSPAPQISLKADNTSLMPDEPAHITYSCTSLPSGDYVTVSGSGTGAQDLWNATNQTAMTESFTETENPGTSDSIPVQYVAAIHDSSGNIVSQATLDLTWTNAWTGYIVLTASPNFLQVQNPSYISATLSASLPSGYVLNIIDQTTGTTIASSVTGSVTDPYARYYPGTDTFVAVINDGYENIGAPSNIVAVTWSEVTLTANPLTLPVGQSTTLTASAQNLPSGDYLVLYDETKSQVVGYAQSTTYTTTQTNTRAQNDSYIAYINTSPAAGGYAASNTVTVDWFSVTLTAAPNDLPVNQTSTLTATTQNVPNGYSLMIIDQTAGKILAQGGTSQTTLSTTVSKPTPQTNNYVGAVAVAPSSALTVSSPTWLTNSSNQSTRPSVALDSSGTKHIVFESYLYNANIPNIAYMTISKSGVESPIMWLTSSTSEASYAPSIVVDSSGTSHVVFGSYLYNGTAENLAYLTVSSSGTPSGISWLTKNGTGYSGIYPSRGVQGGGDDTLQYSSNGKYPYYNTVGPSIAIDSNGVSHIVFNSTLLNSNTLNYKVWNIAYMTVSTGGAPSGLTWLTTDSTYSSTAPNIAVDGNGISRVVFHSVTYNSITSSAGGVGIYNIAYMTVNSSGIPSGLQWLTQSTTYQEDSEFPHIAMDANGTSHVVFDSAIYNFTSNLGAFNTAYMTVSAGGVPSGITWVTTFGLGGIVNIYTDSAIAVDSNGTSQIVFGTVNENSYYGTSQLGYATVSSSSGVSAITWITTALTYSSIVPSLVVDGSGVVHLFFASEIEYPYWLNIAYVAITPPSTMPTIIAAETNPVPVTWYQYQLSLSANPTQLYEGSPTTLSVTSTTGAPSGADIEIVNETTGKVVGTSAANAPSYSMQYTEQSPTTDTFIAYFVNPSNGYQYAYSNTARVQWLNAPLTLSGAAVYHTTAWQNNLNTYNTYYSTHDPSLVRTETTFWAGERLMFRVQPSIPTIAQAYVTVQGLQFSPYVPGGMPENFSMAFNIPLSYDSSTGFLEGSTDPSWLTWFQYLQDGTYNVTFWVKSDDNQIATATTQFTIAAPWVSGNDPRTFFHEHQIW